MYTHEDLEFDVHVAGDGRVRAVVFLPDKKVHGLKNFEPKDACAEANVVRKEIDVAKANGAEDVSIHFAGRSYTVPTSLAYSLAHDLCAFANTGVRNLS